MFSETKLPFQIHKKILKNGLKVAAFPLKTPEIIAFYTVVRAGSRNEIEEGKSGYAHFFEHMMFRGTKDYSSEEYNKVLKLMGADSNAYITDDYTCYHIVAPKENLEKIFEIESDRFINLNYTREVFQKEAGAILGEYRKSASNPIFSLFEKILDNAYKVHTYKHTTMGFLKDILNMPENYEYSKDFYNWYYRPDNAALTVTGDVNPEEIFDLASKYFENWKGQSNIKAVLKEPLQKEQKKDEIKWGNPTLPYIIIGFHGPEFRTEKIDNMALEAIADISFGEISPIYNELVIKTQAANSIEAFWELHRDPYFFFILLRINDVEKLSEIEEKVFDTVKKIQEKGLLGDELEKIKSRKLYSFLSSLNTPSRVADKLAEFFALSGNFDSLEKYVNLYKGLDNETIKNVANKYLKKDFSKVIYYRDNTSPAVVLRLQFFTGSQDDPASKKGLANFVANLIIDGGTKKLSYNEVQKKLWPLAANYYVIVDKASTTFVGEVHKDNFKKFYKIFKELILNPGFEKEDFLRVQKKLINYLENDLKSARDEELGKEVLQWLIYRNHPFQQPVIGLKEDLEKISLLDINGFYNEMYKFSNLKIGIGGPVDEKFVKKIENDFAKFKVSTPPLPKIVEVIKSEGMNFFLVIKDSMVSWIRPVANQNALFSIKEVIQNLRFNPSQEELDF